jgi:hypothetical protein
MKRYIILSAMLVFALNLIAQETNPDRTTRERSTTGTAVKENKNSEKTNKADVKKEKAVERKASRANATSSGIQRSETRTTTRTTRSTPTISSNDRKSNTSVTPERTRVTIFSRKKEVNPGNSGRVAPSSPERTTTIRRSETTLSSKEYIPRNEQQTTEKRRAYTTPERNVIIRTVTNPNYVHSPVEYRRIHYPYRVPSRLDIFWDVHLYREYRYLYPHYDYWYYPVGYRVHTVSAYDADQYIGEFARIYGRVSETWYNQETDEFLLYFGEPYPYQDFTVILANRDARRFSRRPERFFMGKDIAVTGVVSVFEGKPEMVIKRKSQIDLYF